MDTPKRRVRMSDFASFYRELQTIIASNPVHGFDNVSAYFSAAEGKFLWSNAPEDPRALGLDKNECLNLYYWMRMTRAVDEKITVLYKQGKAFGKHLLCTGNEATAVGAAYALNFKEHDWACMAIRDLGAFLVGGMTPEQIIAQPCGKANSLTHGWDASLHMSDPKRHLIGLISHLGTMPCIATGLAFAEEYRGTDGVVLVFSGDGATSTGAFHEALNIAAVRKLPLVVVIENNQWAFGTPPHLQYAVPSLALRDTKYSAHMEGYIIDGTNILAVYETVKNAISRARTERIISIIDARTMRMRGHSLADPYENYVPAEQLRQWEEKDPIASYKKLLLGKGITTESELNAVDETVREEVDDAEQTALASPEPDAAHIEQKIYSASKPQQRPILLEPPGEGRRIKYGEAISEALQELMDQDTDIFLLGEDIGAMGGAFGITKGFLDQFGSKRVIDTPIAETGFCGLAAGAVLQGLRPIVEFQFADFASEAYKMIANFYATHTVRGIGALPVVLRMPAGCTTKNSGMCHSANVESWFAGIPGLKIVAPITSFDVKGLLKSAIYDNNPIIFLEYKEYYRIKPGSDLLPPELNTPLPDGDYRIPFGKARVLKTGTNITLVSYGSQVFRALEAASMLEQNDNLSVEVMDLRSLIPWDTECVMQSAQKTGCVVVSCEAPRTGCFGQTIVQEIQEQAFQRHLKVLVRLVAAADTPVPFAKILEDAHLPTAEKIARVAREMMAP